jgi:hypothetical protein
MPGPSMAPEHPELTVTLEEDVAPTGDGGPRRLRVSSTVRGAEGKAPTPQEVQQAVRALSEQMRHAREGLADEAAAAAGIRADRSTDELVETYHPKSLELVDALLWEGEITPTEHEALRARVTGPIGARAAPGPRSASTPVPPRESGARRSEEAPQVVPAPPTPRREANPPPEGQTGTAGTLRPAARLGPTPPRSVETLLKEMDLKNLRDANVARAKRMISFDEWSALKAYYDGKPA